MKTAVRFIVCILMFFGAGCASAPVTYEDPGSAQPLTTNFGFSDLNKVAAKMVNDMLSHPATVEITAKRRPLIYISNVLNETDQHIDTKSIADTIQTQVLRSGKFRFTEIDTRKKRAQEIEYQNESGMVKKSTAVARGQEIGAEYEVYGSLVSYTERTSTTLRRSYKFTMKLQNIQTGVIEWQNEEPISKQQKRPMVGL